MLSNQLNLKTSCQLRIFIEHSAPSSVYEYTPHRCDGENSLKQFEKYLKKWPRALLWVIGILLLLPWNPFEATTTTQQADETAFVLLAKAIVLLGLVTFTFRIPIRFSRKHGIQAAAFVNTVMLTGLAGIALQMHRAVLKVHLPLDFEHFFQLQRAGGVALIAVLVLATALFLLSHRLLWEVIRSGISQRQRLWGMLIALVLFGVGALFLPDPLTPVQLLLSGIAYVALFDLYIERHTSSLTWLLFWAVAFSAWLALLLFQVNLQEDRIVRLGLARELAVAPAKNPERLIKYDYVVFRQDGQVRDLQGAPPRDLPAEARLFQAGQWQEYFSAARADLIFRNMDGTTVVIGKATGGYRKPMALFSSLFSVLFLLVLALAGVNHFTGLIRTEFELPLCGRPSLRNRIQLATIASILGSFLAFGLLAAAYFRRSSSPELQEEVQVFISAMLNLYVFLLLVATAVAIFVANSITRPLAEIGQKLSNIKLGKNERIAWQGRNELGELIGEYNHMIEKLEESTERLKQSEREGAWREMARQVAHEIKNPLTPMKLSVQHLMRAYQAQPDQAAALVQRVSQTLIEQIDVLSGIASEFSNFAKMPEPQCEQLDLNQLLTTVHSLFETQEDPNLHVECQTPEHPVFVFADRSQLTRVLTNLVKNALQSIPDGREGYVRIALNTSENQAQICVSDNGAGIPEAVQEQVFSPYFTTKSSGTGLGLAMCKSMVEAMNGTIWFETKVGEGTSFFIGLKIFNPYKSLNHFGTFTE